MWPFFFFHKKIPWRSITLVFPWESAMSARWEGHNLHSPSPFSHALGNMGAGLYLWAHIQQSKKKKKRNGDRCNAGWDVPTLRVILSGSSCRWQNSGGKDIY